MKKIYLALICMRMLPMVAAAQVDDLQNYLDNLTNRASRADGFTDIDLSTFTATTRTSALQINNGIKVNFTNGKLVADNSYKGPIVEINDRSYVKISSTASFVTGESTYDYEGFVNVKSGSLQLEGGQLLNYRDNYPWQEMVDLFEDANNRFIMTDGYINGCISVHGGDVQIDKGTITELIFQRSPTSVVRINGNANVHSFVNMLKDRQTYPTIVSPLKYEMVFQTQYDNFENQIFAVGSDEYQLTQADLAKLKFIKDEDDPKEYEFYLEGNSARVREKKARIHSAEDLQAKLDELYEQGYTSYSKVGLIEIPEEGIVLDRAIMVRCYATITGGPLKVMTGFDDWIGADFVFDIDYGARLTLKNITFDGNNQYHHVCTFMNRGDLYFSEGFKAINLSKSDDFTYGFVYSLGSVNIYKASFHDMYNTLIHAANGDVSITGSSSDIDIRYNSTNSPGKVVEGDGTVKMSDVHITYSSQGPAFDVKFFHISGESYVKCDGIAVKADETDYSGGYITANTSYCTGSLNGTNFSLDHMIFRGRTYVGYREQALPNAYFEKDAYVELGYALSKPWTLIGDWKNFLDGTPFIKGHRQHALTQTDMDYLVFKDLPEGYEPVLDTEEDCVRLRSVAPKNSDDLQDFLNSLADGDRGTEENPVEIPMANEVDIDKDVHFDDLQCFIDGFVQDGRLSGLSDVKILKLTDGDVYVGPTTCLTITNLIIDGCTGRHNFFVDGTLVIDVNVFIRHFVDIVIHVRKGGKVIWKGSAQDCNDVIRNEGGEVHIYGSDDPSTGSSSASRYFIYNIVGEVYVHGGENYGGEAGVYNCKDGHVFFIDGWIHGGIVNYGYFEFEGGHSLGGSNPGVTNYGEFIMGGGEADSNDGRSIVTYVNIHICGCANVKDIYIARGVVIHITAHLTTIFRIHFLDENGFELGTPIVVGADNYVLTEDDFKLFEFMLPEGFEAKFDEILKAIVIQKTSGIEDIEADGNSSLKDVYNVSGVKVGDSGDMNSLAPGVYIIDGKKVIKQ